MRLRELKIELATRDVPASGSAFTLSDFSVRLEPLETRKMNDSSSIPVRSPRSGSNHSYLFLACSAHGIRINVLGNLGIVQHKYHYTIIAEMTRCIDISRLRVRYCSRHNRFCLGGASSWKLKREDDRERLLAA